MTQRPLGTNHSCQTCGSDNAWTGAERIGDEVTGLGDSLTGSGERLQLAELRCTKCGRTEWIELGTVGGGTEGQ